MAAEQKRLRCEGLFQMQRRRPPGALPACSGCGRACSSGASRSEWRSFLGTHSPPADKCARADRASGAAVWLLYHTVRLTKAWKQAMLAELGSLGTDPFNIDQLEVAA